MLGWKCCRCASTPLLCQQKDNQTSLFWEYKFSRLEMVRSEKHWNWTNSVKFCSGKLFGLGTINQISLPFNQTWKCQRRNNPSKLDDTDSERGTDGLFATYTKQISRFSIYCDKIDKKKKTHYGANIILCVFKEHGLKFSAQISIAYGDFQVFIKNKTYLPCLAFMFFYDKKTSDGWIYSAYSGLFSFWVKYVFCLLIFSLSFRATIETKVTEKTR